MIMAKPAPFAARAVAVTAQLKDGGTAPAITIIYTDPHNAALDTVVQAEVYDDNQLQRGVERNSMLARLGDEMMRAVDAKRSALARKIG